MVVGHGAMLEGCTIDDGALIGMGAIVLQHAQVGARRDGRRRRRACPSAPRSRRASWPPAFPANVKKELSGAALGWTELAADDYQELREHYLTASRVRRVEDERVT